MFCALTAACELPGRPDELSESHAALTAPTTIAPTSGYGDPGTSAPVDAAGNVNFVGGNWHVPLPVSVGDVIGSISAIVRDNGPANGHTSDGNVIVMQLISHATSGDNARATIISSGSGSQQTLTLAPSGGYCVQAGEEMQVMFVGFRALVPSMAGLVTITPMGSGAVAGTVTVPVPLFGAINDAVFPGRLLSVGVSAGIYGIPVGSTITSMRARVRDNTQGNGGPSKLYLALAEQADDQFVGGDTSWQTGSGTTDGSGNWQTITLNANRVITPLHTYTAGVFFFTGTSAVPGVVSAIDVTYRP